EAFPLQALWRVCCERIAGVPELSLPQLLPPRHRDLLLLATGADTDLLVHDLLTRFCGAFLDQGLAHWQLPRREQGFYRAFRALYGLPAGPPDRWLRGLPAELARLEAEHVGPLGSIRGALGPPGVAAEAGGDFP